MSKESIEIPLVKATYEELQQVICELQVERYKYKITIDKIKEIIKKDRVYIAGERNLSHEIEELLEEIEKKD